MAIEKKWLAIAIITALVIVLIAYFSFSPGNINSNISAKDMSDSIQVYNEKYNLYSTAHSDVVSYGNQMTGDSKITTNELFTYESKITEYINASVNMLAQSQTTKTLVKNSANKFTEADYKRVLSEFDNRVTLIKSEIENVIILITDVRDSIISQTPEHDAILQNLSLELLDIRNS